MYGSVRHTCVLKTFLIWNFSQFSKKFRNSKNYVKKTNRGPTLFFADYCTFETGQRIGLKKISKFFKELAMAMVQRFHLEVFKY